MTSAIFGLVGVIVGAFVTGAVDLFMEHRRKQGTVFKAKRLVGEELQTIWMHLDGLVGSGATPNALSDERRERFLRTSAWETHKETLAQKGVLSDDDWDQLSITLHALSSMRLMILEEAPTHAIIGRATEGPLRRKALGGGTL